jgi:hypothetical protein
LQLADETTVETKGATKMTMKTIELSAEIHGATARNGEARNGVVGQRKAASSWLESLRHTLSKCLERNERAWDRMAEEQARDPNRY